MRGALLKQTGGTRVHSLCKEGQESPVPLSGWQLVSLVPHLDRLWGTGPLPSAGKPGFSCTLAVGGPGLHPPSGGPGFLSPHSRRFSSLSREGLGSHCPTQAWTGPGYIPSNGEPVDQKVPSWRGFLSLPGEAGVRLPRLADRHNKILSLCLQRLESRCPVGGPRGGGPAPVGGGGAGVLCFT